MGGSIRIETEYPHPPERVWTALTDPCAIAEWLMPNDFQPRLGHRFQFRAANARGWSGIVDCEVTRLEPPRCLAYTWKSDKVDTVVEWTLQPTASGTRVELVHSGFKGVGQTILRKFMMGPGWSRMLENVLPGVIARVGPEGFVPGSPKTGGQPFSPSS
jgi:uncharacterized protein YndB with AHSA1/START domain